MLESSRFKGIFQCDKLSVQDQHHQIRGEEEESDHFGGATLPQSITSISQSSVEQGYRNRQIVLPKDLSFKDFPEYNHTHKP